MKIKGRELMGERSHKDLEVCDIREENIETGKCAE